jgi:hypothetical protein
MHHDELILIYWFLLKKLNLFFWLKTFTLKNNGVINLVVFNSKLLKKKLIFLKKLKNNLEIKKKKKKMKTKTDFFFNTYIGYITYIGYFSYKKLDFIFDRFEVYPYTLNFFIKYIINNTLNVIKYDLLKFNFDLKKLIAS